MIGYIGIFHFNRFNWISMQKWRIFYSGKNVSLEIVSEMYKMRMEMSELFTWLNAEGMDFIIFTGIDWLIPPMPPVPLNSLSIIEQPKAVPAVP